MRTHLTALKRPRATRALVVALLAIVLLSACTGPGAQAPPPDSSSPAPTGAAVTAPTDAAAPADPSGDAGTITIGFAAQEFERQQYEPLIAAFNAQNPDIRVQFVAIGDSSGTFSLDELTRQIVSSADTAAVFFLRPEDIASGLMHDLKPLIEADPSFDRDDFYPGALALSGANDGIYLLPRTLRISLLSYNKDLWARRGLPPPKPDWTWSDLLATAEQLAQKRGDTVDVYGLAEGGDGLTALRGLLIEAGVTTTTASVEQIRLDQPQVAAVLERVAALVKSGGLYRSTNANDRVSPDAFLKLIADQQLAMWFGAPVMIGPNMPKPTFETGFAPLPPTGADSFGAEGYVMSSGTAHPEAAWRWLSFLSRQQVQLPFMDASIAGSVPARKSLAERSGYWKQLDRSLLLAAGAAGLVALLLTVALSRRILGPIEALTAAARRMEKGDLSQRVAVRSKDEIGELGQAFNAMAGGLARIEQLRRHMVTDVAHELRTPLTNIRGYLEALRDGVAEPSAELIGSLHEEALLLNRLVDDLQDLALAEAGQLRLARRPTSLVAIVEQAVGALRPMFDEKSLMIDVQMPAELPCVDADPERIGQVLRNLLNNAITHTPAGGSITVEAALDHRPPTTDE